MSQDLPAGPQVARVQPEALTEEQWAAMPAPDRCVHLTSALLNAIMEVPEYRGDGGYLAVGEVDGVPYRVEVVQEGAEGIGKALSDAQAENVALRQSATKLAEFGKTVNDLCSTTLSMLLGLSQVMLSDEATDEQRRAAAQETGDLAQQLIALRSRGPMRSEVQPESQGEAPNPDTNPGTGDPGAVQA